MTVINMFNQKQICCQMLLLFTLYAAIFILFIIFARYDNDEDEEIYTEKYPIFQDIHAMIFIGFGFLMTFLKKYGYSSVSFNLLVGAFLIQWAILCNGFFKMKSNSKIAVGIVSLMEADVAVACVLISMGAVLGKTSYLQLIVMGIVEVALYASNKYLCVHVFQAADTGESMFVHVFGAYYGLAVSFAMRPSKTEILTENKNEGSSYTSDLFAMIGTIFLWIFWPSFNAGGVSGAEQHRAIINTYLSLGGSCIATFIASSLVNNERRFQMAHVQNGTLAGGVAIGCVANLMVEPYGALLIGFTAGTFCVIGFHYIQPWLFEKIQLHDTCGVNNLHGIPGILAGLVGILMAAIANEETYDDAQMYSIYPARASVQNTISDTTASDPTVQITENQNGLGRTASEQALYQLIALGVTLGIAIISGFISGFLMDKIFVKKIPIEHQYQDSYHFDLPDTEDHCLRINFTNTSTSETHGVCR